MRRKTLLAIWYSAPLLPIAAYGIRLGAVFNTYFLSVALGLAAYTYFCGLLVINSRPGYALRALGEDGLTGLMARTPFLILVLSLIHGILKTGLFARPWIESMPRGLVASILQTLKRGLSLGGLKAENILGGILVALFLLFSFLGFIYLKKKPRPVGYVARVRAWIFTPQGWTAWGSLILYLGTAAISLFALWHILGASSTSFSANPIGAAILIAELGYGLFSWLGARIREGWKAPSPSLVREKFGPKS